jgi:hypothetical protein
MDGYESWSGAYIVDRMVRDGAGAAAHDLVLSVAHGWDCVGNKQLTEPDDFLGGDVVSDSTSREILERHYAVYVIDVDAARLEVCANGVWLEPAQVTGADVVLPAWYPQLGSRSFAKRRRPEPVTRALQKQCRSLGLNWGSVCEALRRWITLQLAIPSGCAWLYLGGSNEEHVRCLVDDTFVYASVDSINRTFTAADGRMRSFNVDDMDALAGTFRELGLPGSRTQDIVKQWLTLAARHGADDRALYADWFSGSKRWSIERDDGVGRAPLFLLTPGCFPTLLCWLF